MSVCWHFPPIYLYWFLFSLWWVMTWCSSLGFAQLKFIYFFMFGINTVHISTIFFFITMNKTSSCSHVIFKLYFVLCYSLFSFSACLLKCVGHWYSIIAWLSNQGPLTNWYSFDALQNPCRVPGHLHIKLDSIWTVRSLGTAATTDKFLLLYYCHYELFPWVS